MEISLPELWQMEMDQLKLETEKDPDDVIWRFSPLDINEFDIMLNIAHNLAVGIRGDITDFRPGDPSIDISFVEAGCGIGTKLYLAKHKYLMIEYGYEINEEYIAKCHELGVQAELRDLTADPPPTWSAYDIVYTCRPLKNDVAEVQWEKSVHEAMRPGAVLMASFVALKPYNWPCYYRQPFRGIWVKPEPGEELKREATRARVQGRARELAGLPA
jgi:SAM-dependent methyltransferase